MSFLALVNHRPQLRLKVWNKEGHRGHTKIKIFLSLCFFGILAVNASFPKAIILGLKLHWLEVSLQTVDNVFTETSVFLSFEGISIETLEI